MSNKLKKILKGTALGLSLGLLISATIIGVKIGLHGKLPPDSVVAGINLAYKAPQEAINILQEKEAEFLAQPIRISVKIPKETEARTAEIYPQEISVEYFPIETIATIERMDLKNQSIPQVLQKQQKESKEILYTFDPELLIQKTNEKLQLREVAPQNATYFINTESKLDITEERSGLLVNYNELSAKVKESISQMSSIRMTLPLYEAEPTITKENLETLKEEIVGKLKHKVTMKYEKYSWDFTPIHHLDWIEFVETNIITLPHINFQVELDSKYLPDALEQKEKNIKIQILDEKLNEYLGYEVTEYIETEVDPVSIYKDEEGEIVIDGTGKDGIKIQTGALKKSLELAINNKINEVEIQTKTILAPITISKDLQEMGVKELLATGHTSFYGSPSNRIHNINTGVEKFTGTLIAPDEEFSFNTRLGEVDASTGYRKELVITKKGTIPEYGGGLCQVSTTVYRAAIFAGLPITNRAPHSYAVSYYSQIFGYGLDATIYLGGQDLKFINDTPGHILIHSYTDGMHAYFKFYGTSDGRKVSMDGPELSNYKYPSTEVIYVDSPDLAPGETKQVGARHTGFDALWYRNITYPDGNSTTEEIFSRYKATQEKYWVGPSAN